MGEGSGGSPLSMEIVEMTAAGPGRLAVVVRWNGQYYDMSGSLLDISVGPEEQLSVPADGVAEYTQELTELQAAHAESELLLEPKDTCRMHLLRMLLQAKDGVRAGDALAAIETEVLTQLGGKISDIGRFVWRRAFFIAWQALKRELS